MPTIRKKLDKLRERTQDNSEKDNGSVGIASITVEVSGKEIILEPTDLIQQDISIGDTIAIKTVKKIDDTWKVEYLGKIED